MKRGGPLKRRARLRPISSKRAAQQLERNVLRMRMAVAHPMCQVCGCCGSVDLHEKLFRSRGGSPTDEANVVAVCRGPGSCDCHGRAHRDKEWAEANGLRVSQYERRDRW